MRSSSRAKCRQGRLEVCRPPIARSLDVPTPPFPNGVRTRDVERIQHHANSLGRFAFAKTTKADVVLHRPAREASASKDIPRLKVQLLSAGCDEVAEIRPYA